MTLSEPETKMAAVNLKQSWKTEVSASIQGTNGNSQNQSGILWSRNPLELCVNCAVSAWVASQRWPPKTGSRNKTTQYLSLGSSNTAGLLCENSPIKVWVVKSMMAAITGSTKFDDISVIRIGRSHLQPVWQPPFWTFFWHTAWNYTTPVACFAFCFSQNFSVHLQISEIFSWIYRMQSDAA